MEIIVEGKAEENFSPNEINLNLDFIAKDLSYENVLSKGVRNVELFVNDILLKNNFKKDDMKTSSFVIREEKKYDESTKKYNFDGYSFRQNALLKFDYDKELLAKLMVELSKLENSPVCQFYFGIKDERDVRRTLLSKAYEDAENQALAIASAAGKELKSCQKVDFKPFTTSYISNSSFGSDMMSAAKRKSDTASSIVNTFTPEDVKLMEKLYCLWIAE